MKDIYKAAKEVIAWLGPEAKESGLAMTRFRAVFDQILSPNEDIFDVFSLPLSQNVPIYLQGKARLSNLDLQLQYVGSFNELGGNAAGLFKKPRSTRTLLLYVVRTPLILTPWYFRCIFSWTYWLFRAPRSFLPPQILNWILRVDTSLV